jgi:hypothetical protein
MLILKSEIEKELESLERLRREMAEVLNKDSHSFLETRAAGSIIHDFYSGIEKIFKRIAVVIDRDLPAGEEWHSDLLNRMSIAIEDIRPAVISNDLKDDLGDYLRFRHLFRNIYGFELKWNRCRNMGEKMDVTLDRFKEEIEKFLEFVDSIKNIS